MNHVMLNNLDTILELPQDSVVDCSVICVAVQTTPIDPFVRINESGNLVTEHEIKVHPFVNMTKLSEDTRNRINSELGENYIHEQVTNLFNEYMSLRKSNSKPNYN